MSRETHRVTVTEKSRIFKFAEGADPTKDEPYEISEFETVHTGDAANCITRKFK